VAKLPLESFEVKRLDALICQDSEAATTALEWRMTAISISITATILIWRITFPYLIY